MTPPYLTADEVATHLQLDRSTVYRLADSDPSFPATRIGRSLRVRADRLEAWLSSRTQGARR